MIKSLYKQSVNLDNLLKNIIQWIRKHWIVFLIVNNIIQYVYKYYNGAVHEGCALTNL